jgi:Amt family ammonium transporter
MACENGFTDFAGSSVAVGWLGIISSHALVGPRIEKYTDGTVNAIPGHNLMLGALGCLFYGLMVWF